MQGERGHLCLEHQLSKLRVEYTLSYLTQIAGIVFQNFVSTAVGIAVSAALVRGSP